MHLENNTILITGGTGGFGLEFAAKLLALRNRVIITGRDAQKLADVKKRLPALHIIQSDVSRPDDILALYGMVREKFPDLNILINNAGEMRKISLHHPRTPQDITREIEINLMGPIRMVQAFLPLLKAQPAAAIMNVTSGIALTPFPIAPVYSASKAGLRSYTQALRVQLKNTAIKVVELVAPGASTTLSDQFIGLEGFRTGMLMAPEKVVDAAIRGLQSGKEEIYPGLAKAMRVMSRIAPNLLIAQSGKMGASYISGS